MQGMESVLHVLVDRGCDLTREVLAYEATVTVLGGDPDQGGSTRVQLFLCHELNSVQVAHTRYPKATRIMRATSASISVPYVREPEGVLVDGDNRGVIGFGRIYNL